MKTYSFLSLTNIAILISALLLFSCEREDRVSQFRKEMESIKVTKNDSSDELSEEKDISSDFIDVEIDNSLENTSTADISTKRESADEAHKTEKISSPDGEEAPKAKDKKLENDRMDDIKPVKPKTKSGSKDKDFLRAKSMIERGGINRCKTDELCRKTVRRLLSDVLNRDPANFEARNLYNQML